LVLSYLQVRHHLMKKKVPKLQNIQIEMLLRTTKEQDVDVNMKCVSVNDSQKQQYKINE
jgi:hypothetical protein